MKKLFIPLFFFLIVVLGLSSCDRSWIINVDGYILHKTDGNYYIAQIPDSVRNESVYEVPEQIGDYQIYGFGSDRPLGFWAGQEEIDIGYIRKLVIKSHIKSVCFDTYKNMLIETEQPLSEIKWNSYGLNRYSGWYFLSPKRRT